MLTGSARNFEMYDNKILSSARIAEFGFEGYECR